MQQMHAEWTLLDDMKWFWSWMKGAFDWQPPLGTKGHWCEPASVSPQTHCIETCCSVLHWNSNFETPQKAKGNWNRNFKLTCHCSHFKPEFTLCLRAAFLKLCSQRPVWWCSWRAFFVLQACCTPFLQKSTCFTEREQVPGKTCSRSE